MKWNKIYVSLLLGTSLFTTSCDDFLDKVPDNRAELNTDKQIAQFLTSGYFTGNYGPLCELSSDNLIDNNSPHKNDKGKEVYYNLSSMERMEDEAFAFEPIKSSTSQDSPTAIWQGCYMAIAVANHALEAIERLESEGKSTNKLSSAKGEALLIRAYNHFLLVNVFSQAYKNPELSKNDIGIPYVTKPETKVLENYERGNVADVYKKIEEDMLAGLALVRDEYFEKAAQFHFNIKAAHAFATRYYLFTRQYDKVVKHADNVLGVTASSAKGFLMNWYMFEGSSSIDDYANAWISTDQPNNLLLVSTYSVAMRRYLREARYACNADASEATLYRFEATCNLKPNPNLSNSGLFLSGKQEYGLFQSKVMERFEYKDKTAGTGYPHIVRRELTCSETLLCRAEAKIMMKDTLGGLDDLKAYTENRKDLPNETAAKYFPDNLALSPERIRTYYTKEANPLVVLDYNTERMSSDFIIDPKIKPYFDCVMDYRRLETIFDGLRFFDIKRLGLEITHSIGKSAEKITLTWDDPRRAIEVPQETLAAGLESSLVKKNTRTPISVSTYVVKDDK